MAVAERTVEDKPAAEDSLAADIPGRTLEEGTLAVGKRPSRSPLVDTL